MKQLDEWALAFRKMGHLGEALVRYHKITPSQLAIALDIQREQKTHGKFLKLGEILIENKDITEDDILDVYQEELDLPRMRDVTIGALEIQGLNREIFSQFISLPDLEKYEFLLYRSQIKAKDENIEKSSLDYSEEWNIFCLIHDPLQESTIRELFTNIFFEHGSRFLPPKYSVTEEVLKKSALYNVATMRIYTMLARRGDILRAIEDLKENRNTSSITAAEHSMAQLWHEVCQFGISQGCSDIHVAPSGSKGGLRIRYRKDGQVNDESKFMYGSDKFPFQRYEEFLNVLFDQSKGMDRLLMNMHGQDGAIQEFYKGKIYDIRVSSTPIILEAQKRCKLTLRIHSERGAKNLESIGLLPERMNIFRQLYSKHSGLFLLTGPTSSGKTTTLHAILRRFDLSKQTCYTIEDPVEHKLQGAYQIQINEKEGLTFPSALRNLLRQDPNIVLVGEMRDPESVQIVLDIANTGHAIFSTIHANSAYQVPQRLLNMGVHPYQLFSSLNAVVSQRLVMKNCMHCLVPYEPANNEHRLLGLKANVAYKRGSGIDPTTGEVCSKCGGRGYEGRVGIFEILPLCMYPEWENHAETPERLKSFFDGIKDENGEILFPELIADAHKKMEMGWVSPGALAEVFSRIEG